MECVRCQSRFKSQAPSEIDSPVVPSGLLSFASSLRLCSLRTAECQQAQIPEVVLCRKLKPTFDLGAPSLCCYFSFCCSCPALSCELCSALLIKHSYYGLVRLSLLSLKRSHKAPSRSGQYQLPGREYHDKATLIIGRVRPQRASSMPYALALPVVNSWAIVFHCNCIQVRLVLSTIIAIIFASCAATM